MRIQWKALQMLLLWQWWICQTIMCKCSNKCHSLCDYNQCKLALTYYCITRSLLRKSMLYFGYVETSIATIILGVKLIITLERHIMWLCRHIIVPGMVAVSRVTQTCMMLWIFTLNIKILWRWFWEKPYRYTFVHWSWWKLRWFILYVVVTQIL